MSLIAAIIRPTRESRVKYFVTLELLKTKLDLLDLSDDSAEEKISLHIGLAGSVARFSDRLGFRVLADFVQEDVPGRRTWDICEESGCASGPVLIDEAYIRIFREQDYHLQDLTGWCVTAHRGTLQLETPNAPEPPAVPPAKAAECAKEIRNKVGWAIYCRVQPNKGSAEARDRELARQSSTCVNFAIAEALMPISGTCQFSDCCHEKCDLMSRPGFQALLDSGATGILCVSRKILCSGGKDLGAHGLDIVCVMPKWSFSVCSSRQGSVCERD
jgi:hypothetical protein